MCRTLKFQIPGIKKPFVPVNGQLAPTDSIINIVVVDAGRNCTLEFVMEHTSEYFFGFY